LNDRAVVHNVWNDDPVLARDPAGADRDLFDPPGLDEMTDRRADRA
jgi:hypothetical protein